MLKILLATFVIMSHFAIAEEKTEKIEKPSAKKTPTQCHDLHKVTDIDGLFLQMYNNLDSHCLFEIPKEELEEVWGIPFFEYNYEKKVAHEQEILYKEHGKGLFIVRHTNHNDKCVNAFVIKKTKKYEKEHNGFGGSFLKGKLSKELPSPAFKDLDKFSCYIREKRQIVDMLFIWDKKHKKNHASIAISTICGKQIEDLGLYYCNFNFKDKDGSWKDD